MSCRFELLANNLGEDHPVVLLIDELKALAAPIDEHAGCIFLG
jgi:hypothetical protein